MKRLSYHLVDVFTDRAFGGNPLAVFTDGGTVPESVMQPIAKELNLSETTFVLPPRDPKSLSRAHLHAGRRTADGRASDRWHGFHSGAGRIR